MLNNKAYDILKWIALCFLPGIATLYFTVASIWGLPYTEEVVGTIAAITVFIGVLLGISTDTYKKSGANTDGVLQIDSSNAEKDIYRLQLNGDLGQLSEKTKVTFNVDPHAKLLE